jgi:signal peptidase I
MRPSRPRPALAILVAILASLVAKAFVVDAAVVDGRSMLPLLKPGAVVLVLRCAYGLRLPSGDGYVLRWSAPRPGDVVAAASPRDGRAIVKRVAASAGTGAFILLGDNLPESIDSRTYGPVALGAIKGRILFVSGGARP